ncbi:MAG: hypothetical protein MUF48_22295 [Pirellulaceae bacterium]|nr:hypothetical protein [Pirellulaceae bacterium]
MRLWLLICSGVIVPRYGLAQEPSRGAEDEDAVRARGVLVLNEDNSHFFGTRRADDMTLKGLQAFVDQYADSAVTHLFLCPNAMRASFRSRTRDAIWDPVSGVEPTDTWPQNAKRLSEAGLDPYAVWISRCRQRRISPWLSMRMNDVHSVDEPDNFMHSSFWRTSGQYWRVPHGSPSPWVNRALNYAHAEVREHQLALVRELLDRYDMDGLELDWMRFGYHLTPGREREEGLILTEFVREVRSLTRDASRSRGHQILLSVRVPTHPDAAAGLGLDAVGWARDGLVDWIVPSPFWTSSDFDIPVELWLDRLGDARQRVTVLPALEYNARPWPGAAAVANDLASARGFAASALERGAPGVYLFNWMDSETRPVAADEYRTLLQEGLSADLVACRARRHPVCYRDTVPAGFPDDICLPVDAAAGGEFRLHIGPQPAAARVWLIVGLSAPDESAETRWEASLNGHALGEAEVVDSEDVQRLGGGAVHAVRFAGPAQSCQSGYNQIRIRRTAGTHPQQIVWVEVNVHGPLDVSR